MQKISSLLTTREDSSQAAGAAVTPGDYITLEQLLGIARRQFMTFAACCFIAVLFGAAYYLFSTKIYSASSQILLSPVIVLPDEQLESLTLNSRGLDEAYVDSQVEIVKSENVVLAIARKLDLTDDPRFIDNTPSVIASLISFLKFWKKEDEGEDLFRRERSVVGTLEENLLVERVEDTYVLNINYTSEYPELSALIANELARSYIAEQNEAKYSAARRAVTELNALLEEARKQSSAANLRLEQFRKEHDLITAGDTVVEELQLIEINRSLMEAIAARTAAEARVTRVKAIDPVGEISTMGLETIDNPIVNDYRARYLEYAAQHERALDEFGSEHPRTKQLVQEMAATRAIINKEFARVTESYEIDYEVALDREEMVRKEFQSALAAVARQKTFQEEYIDLRSEAEMYRTLYESMLRRHQFALQQQQSIPVSEARIISEAVRPLRPVHPRKSVTLAISLLAGAALGVAVGLLRERAVI